MAPRFSSVNVLALVKRRARRCALLMGCLVAVTTVSAHGAEGVNEATLKVPVAPSASAARPTPLDVDTENVLSQSQATGEDQVITVSKASELVYGYTDFGWPSAEHPLRLGIVRFQQPAPLEGLVDATVQQLKNFFGEESLLIRYLSLEELTQAVRNGELDIFLASSGRYRRLVLAGARDLATGLSKNYPNPNKSEAVAMVVSADRTDLEDLHDLKGKRLVTSTRGGFTGYDVPMGEIARSGYDPNGFFFSTEFLGDGPQMSGAFEILRERKADVAFMRLCYLEEHLAEHPEARGQFKVVHEKTQKGEVCRRSTELYPAWTMATTAQTDPRLSRLVTRALLQMPPAGENGFYWGVATDFASVDTLFESLHIGPYEYLDEWTIERVWEKARGTLLTVLIGLLALVGHSLRVGYLVRIRTEALTKSLDEQRKLEREARAAAERMDRLEKMSAVGQLSSIFAHEMRQPLSAMSLYRFALKKALAKREAQADGGPSFATEQAILDKLEREGERANEIVERVRGYAKSDHPPRRAERLASVIERAAKNLELSARFRGKIVRSGLPEVQVVIDALGFELVFVNLIKNGLEAASGTAVPEVRITMTVSETDGVAIAITDNGPPVSSASVAALNGALQTTKPNGLGLGLSIVRGILEAHGAQLTYEILPEGGVCAHVRLPSEMVIASPDRRETPPVEASGAPNANKEESNP